MRRGLLIALGVMFALVIVVLLGVASPAGTRWIARRALSVVNERVNGAIRVGRIQGSTFGNLTLTDVDILDRSGERLVGARRLEVGFSPIGLLQRDIVLDPLVVEGLFLRLVPRPDGVGYTISDVFASDDTAGVAPPAPRVVIENAQVTDGTVLIHRHAREPQDNDNGTNGILTVEQLHAVFPVARLSSPDSADPLAFEIAEASATMRDPPVGLRELRGEVELQGDTIRIGNAVIVTSRSRAQVDGWFVQDSAFIIAAADLSVAIPRLETSEFAWVADSVPAGLVVSGAASAKGERSALRVDVELLAADSAGAELAFIDTEGILALAKDERLQFTNLDIAVLRANLTGARRAGVPVPTDGTLRAQGRLTGNLNSPRLDGSIAFADGSGRRTNLRGIMGVRYDGAQVLGVTAHVQLDSLWLEQAGEAVPDAQLQGALGGTIDAEGPLAGLPFEVRLGGPAGRVAANGTLRWVRETLSLDSVELSLEELDASLISRGAVETSLNAVVQVTDVVLSDTGQIGRAALRMGQSMVAGLAIDSARADVRATRERLFVDTVTATGPAMQVAAGGSLGLVPDATHQLAGQLRVDSLRTLAELLGDSAMAEQPLAGSVAARFTLTGASGSAQVAATATSDRILWGEYAANGLVVEGTWREADTGIVATAEADSVAVAAMRLDDVTAQVDGAGSAWDWSLSTLARGQGPWLGGGRLVTDSAGYSTTVDSLSLELRGIAWRAEPGGRLALSSTSQVASDLVLRRTDGPGRIAVVGTVPADDSAHLEVTVDSLPFRDVVRFLGDTTSEATGRIDGRLVVDGRAAAPRYDLAAFLRDAQLDTVRLPEISVEARYADGEARGTALIVHEGRNLVRAEGVMPARLGFPPAIRADSAPITVAIAIDSIPGTLIDRLVPAVHDVEGALTGTVDVTGTLDNPDMRGTLVLSGGRATIPGLGTSWRDMRGTLRFAGDSVTIDRLRLSDDSDGDLVANGAMRLDRLTDPRLNLEIQARDFLLIDTELYGGVDASGVVTLTGRPRSMALAGFLHIDAAEIHVPEVANPDIVDLSDSLFRRFVDTTVLAELRPDEELSAALMAGLQIDSLRVTLGNDVWVRSEEANIQLGGGVLVRKYGESYPIIGEISAVRGTYTMFLGTSTRAFTVTGGTIDFLRSDSLDADIDINARHTLRTVRGDQMTVTVHIGGTISTPRIDLSSDRIPALPQTEIISYLMFGAPTAQVFVGSDGRQRRSFFDAGAEQFSALLAGRLEGNFGGSLDYFAITPGDPSGGYTEAEILVGKQLELFGNPAFVTVSPRLCPGQPIAGLRRLGLSIETWLTRQWMLDASLDPRRGCAAPNTATNSLQLGIDLLWVKK